MGFDTEEKVLQNFLLDIECLDELIPWIGKVNFFDILKVSKKEVYHSNMLAWLLDPNENHSLGDVVLKGILQRLVKDRGEKYNAFHVLLSDLYSFSVYREWKRIDILLVSKEEKIVYAIENKVGSHEHGNQLNKYRETLEKEYSDYKRFYIFLTPEGEEPSDSVNWDILTYADVVEVLESLPDKIELQPDIELIIKNYINVIRRDIVEDRNLIEICNRIYSKHKSAFDLIFENVKIDNSLETEIICKTLQKKEEEGKIIFNDNNRCLFYTHKMDEFLPQLNDPQRNWGDKTNRVYCYWFEKSDNKLIIHFELGYKNGAYNLPEDIKMKSNALIMATGKTPNYKYYKRLYRKSITLSEDNYEDSIRNAVLSLVKSALDFEEKTLHSIAETESV